jgi:hypothetical protein
LYNKQYKFRKNAESIRIQSFVTKHCSAEDPHSIVEHNGNYLHVKTCMGIQCGRILNKIGTAYF